MKIRIASAALFCLLFAAFAYASPQEQDEPKSKETSPAMQHPDAKPETKPETQEQKPDEMKPEKNDKQDKKDAQDQEKENENKDREKQERSQEKKSGKAQETGTTRHENSGSAHPAGKGGHIPDDKFRASFGRSHTFHPGRPTIVNNQPTFGYGGYTFVLVNPWPSEWVYTDDCYIDYIDGEYFLFDALHPDVRVALFISM